MTDLKKITESSYIKNLRKTNTMYPAWVEETLSPLDTDH